MYRKSATVFFSLCIFFAACKTGQPKQSQSIFADKALQNGVGERHQERRMEAGLLSQNRQTTALQY